MKLVNFIIISTIYLSITSCSSTYCSHNANITIPLKDFSDNKGNVIYKTFIDFPLNNTVSRNHPLSKQLVHHLMSIHSYQMQDTDEDLHLLIDDPDTIEAYIKLSSYCGDDSNYYYFALSKKAFHISNSYGIKDNTIFNIAPFLTERQKNAIKNFIPEWRKNK